MTRLLVGSLVARVDDADVWWVAAAGRQMLATGEVPRRNGFSFVEAAHPWVMHEWLFGPPYAAGLGALGPRFFALVSACAFALTGALVVAATVGRARHLAVGCVAAFIAVGMFAHPTARPTWVALALPAAMALLAFRETFGRIAACGCVALELVWANAHGSFPLGVVLLAAAAWDAAVDRRRRIATALAAAAVTLVNPYGLRLHALVLDYLVGSPGHGFGDLTPIVEYAPLWDARYFAVNSVAATLALGGLVLLAVLALRGAHRARGVLVLALVPLAVVHARFAPTLAVVAAIVLLPALDDAVARTRLAAYAGGAWRPGWAAIGGYAAALAGLAAVAFATVASRPADAWIDPALGGPSFLRLASQLPDGASVVTPFRSAGLLLWRTSPRGVRVFYDSRNDPYSAEMRHVGLTLLEQSPEAIRDELERRGTTYALVPSLPTVEVGHRQGYDGALAAAPGWSVRARDGGWCTYARSPTP
ncbi:MAG TPA: hypothetical protein VIJ22_01860 [Polyangiaceae bacterium]